MFVCHNVHYYYACAHLWKFPLRVYCERDLCHYNTMIEFNAIKKNSSNAYRWRSNAMTQLKVYMMITHGILWKFLKILR